jgi:hypothetical protein
MTASQLGGLQWVQTSGPDIHLNPPPDGTGAFVAPHPDPTANSVTVTLQLVYLSGTMQGQAADTKTITIVEPSSQSYLVPSPLFIGAAHNQCSGFIQVVGEIHILPPDVSFRHILFQEGTAYSSASGYYASQNNAVHVPAHSSTPALPTDATSGSIAGDDTIQTSPYDFDPYSTGIFTWNIPWTYTIGSYPPKKFKTVQHVATMTLDHGLSTVCMQHSGSGASNIGTVCISKDKVGPVCKSTDDPASTN